jgi:mono/diheme cytochrome c family protein
MRRAHPRASARAATVRKDEDLGRMLRIAGAATAAAAILLGAGLARAADAPGDLVARGKYLATAADCVACHTGKDAKPFSGGLPINTPFGVIYSPNITPDKDTGIGAWTDEQFYASLHNGLGHDGENLYPAMPYTSYTKVTKEDVQAIRAYLNTVPAVHAPDKANELPFPFSVRTSLDVWRGLYFTEGTFKPDPNQSAQINRGAYLVEGLGHCGECHTTRTSLGGLDSGRTLAGGVVDGWYAPNISSDMRAGIGSWSMDELVAYLKNGAVPGKGVAAGPMAQVVHESLSKLTDDDIKAMAAYLKSTPAKEDVTGPKPDIYRVAAAPGSDTYLTFCAGCHQVNGQGIKGQIPALDGNGAVTAQGPQDIIRTIVGGLYANGGYGPMPALGADMTNQQIADVTNYIRNTWSNRAPATAEPAMVADLKTRTPASMTDAKNPCPGPDATSATSYNFADPGQDAVALMGKVTEDKLQADVRAVVDKAKAANPKAGPDAIVNGLINAYCPVVDHESGLTMDQKRWKLLRFGQIAYGELSNTKQVAALPPPDATAPAK